MARTRVTFDQTALKLWAQRSPKARAGMDRLAARALVAMKAATPVSPVYPVYASRGATVPGGTRYPGDFPLRPSGYLRSSVHAFRMPDGSIVIGATAPYARFVNDGTPPHLIRSHGPWPLRNRATGQVFGSLVHHPGTRGFHFVERAAGSLNGVTIHLG